MHIPELPSCAPSRGNAFSQGVGRLVLRLAGWEYQGEWPQVSQCVVIVAPHTSNWDFIIGLAAALACRINVRWLGKDTLFKTPLARFFRWQGGIPAIRDQAQGLVGSIVDIFEHTPQMWLAIAPEGTRSQVNQWRSGFYHIAHGAKVPIIPVAFDAREKKIRIFEAYETSGEIDRDLAELQSLYKSMKGISRY